MSTTRRAVVFDYGLTLVTFEFPKDELLRVLEDSRAAIADAIGRPAPSAGELLRMVLEPLEQAIANHDVREVDYLDFYREAWLKAGLDLPQDLLYRILDAEQRCWDGAVVLAPGALETLDRLRERGLRLGLASNAPFPPEMMARQVLGNGVGERMDAIVFSSEVGWRKPDARLYQAALDRLGVGPEAAVYVGDRQIEDHDGPRAVGMAAVLSRQLAREPISPEASSIASLSELENWLDAKAFGDAS